MDGVREEFTNALGISRNDEVRLHLRHLSGRGLANFGRPPTADEEEEGRRGWLLRRGGLIPPPKSIAHCAEEKVGDRMNQSPVFRNFAGEWDFSIGAKLSELMPQFKPNLVLLPAVAPS